VLFFKIIKQFHAKKTHFDKSISVNGSYNLGIWGQNHQPLGANEGSEAEPPGAAAILQFYSLFSKKYTFLDIL